MIPELEELSKEIEEIQFDTDMKAKDFKRQRLVEISVTLVDQIIMEYTDGSLEETNYLTAKIAQELIEKALNPFTTDLLRADLELPHILQKASNQ